MKKFFIISGIIVVVLIAAISVVPFLFKDKIVTKVKTAINENVNAKVDFGDFDLSVWKHFPNLTFTLNDLSVVGVDDFKGDTLCSIKQFETAINLFDVVKGSNYSVNAIYLRSPRIFAKVLANGKANYNITKPSKTPENGSASESKPFHFSLKKYAIENGYIIWDDKTLKQSAKIVGLNHEGSGDFTSDLFTLVTQTDIEQLTYNFGGINYLNNTKTSYKATFEIDNKNSKYTFKDNELTLNVLTIAFEGWLAMPKNDIDMDIKFASKQTDFKNIFSLVPGAFTKDYNNIKTAGSMAFNGFVKGTYNDKAMPAYNVTLLCKNGMVQYPSLPKAINNINLDLNVNCPDGNVANAIIKIPTCHFEMGTAPFDLSLLLTQPTTAMNLDMKAKGKLDLGEMNKMMPMEGVTKLSGLMDMDLAAKGSLKAVQEKHYENFFADGNLLLKNVEYASKDFTKGVLLRDMNMHFNPKNVDLKSFDCKLSESNISATGSLENVIGYALTNQTLGGNLNLKMDYLNVDEWMTPTSQATPTTDNKTQPTPTSIFKVPNNIDFVMTSAVNKIHYTNMDLQNVNGGIVVKDEKMQLQNLKAEMLGGSMVVSGGYSTKNTTLPDIDLTYDIKDFDIQQSFKTFNTVKKIAPFAEFTKGKFTTNLSMTGKMLADMSPDLATINGNGYFSIFSGSISNYPPIAKIMEALQMKGASELPIKDLKTWFEIHNGKIEIKPFDIKSNDLVMNISGTQSLDSKIDFLVKMDMPRKMLGAAAGAAIDQVIGLANSKGANLSSSDKIKFDVMIGGTNKNPIVKTGLKDALKSKASDLKNEAEAKAKEEIAKAKADAEAKAKAEADKIKQQGLDAANKAKQDALNAANKAKADVEAQAKAAADKAKQDAKNKAKDALKGLFK
ncbi:MAG: hypothetical protein RJA07_1516 [Bacteroidota bacterium]|jgi:hypothetical protein